MPYPVGGRELEIWASLEASLEVISLDQAVELCRERIVLAVAAQKRTPGNLAYFAQVLADEAARRRLITERKPPSVALPRPDAAWLEMHPGSSERWEELRRNVELTSYPDRLAENLTIAIQRLQAEFSEAATA